jgi:hypothetical protein
VLTIGVPAVEKLFKEDSHPETVPVWPDKVSVAEFDPEQTLAADEIDPATDTGDTVIVTEAVVALAQLPDWTMAL